MRFSLQALFLSFVLIWSSLAAFAWHGIWVAGLLLALAALLRVSESPGRRLTELILFLLSSAVFGSLLFMPSIGGGPPGPRGSCMNHIRLLAFALDNYHAQYGHFPPACTTDADGKPMHSWRVYLLPDFGRNDLYKRYDFSQPWNSPTNQQLAASMPDVFRCPGDPATGSNCTNYVAVVGPNTAWPGSTPRKLADFGEHADETILLVEIADSDINWLEPRDLSFEEAKTGIHGPGEPGISSHHLQYDRYFNQGDYCAVVVFANRHTQFLSTRTPPETLESLLTIGGPKSIDWGPPAQNHSRRDRKVAVIVIAITFLLLVLRPKLPEVQ